MRGGPYHTIITAVPKTFLTHRDIEDLARQGITTLTLDENTLLTDLAREAARQYGVAIVSASAEGGQAPSGPADRPAAGAEPARRNLLRFSPGASEAALRAAIVETGRIAYQSGLMISNDGNISARMTDGSLLITPSGVCKGRIGPEDLLVIDPMGRLVKPAADPSLKPTSEQPMHLEVYRQRPDVRAVIHTHLVFANALVISQGSIRMDVIPEAAVAFGSIPVTSYSLPSSPQNAEAIRGLIGSHNVLLIRNHGSLAVGRDLDEALIHTERLEHIAKTLIYAGLLGKINPLPPEMLEAIRQARKG